MSNKVIQLGVKNNTNIIDDIYVDISMQAVKNLRNINTQYNAVQTYNLEVFTNVDNYNNQKGLILINDGDETFLIKSLQDKQDSENLQLKIDRNINIKAVQNSLDNIFSWIPGERILNPEFGNNLYKYLYEGITEYTEELIVAEIKNCVLKWEPRVSIINVYNVSTVQDTEDNTIVLDIEYYINGLEGTIYRKEYRFNRNEE